MYLIKAFKSRLILLCLQTRLQPTFYFTFSFLLFYLFEGAHRTNIFLFSLFNFKTIYIFKKTPFVKPILVFFVISCTGLFRWTQASSSG